ncbi:MAG: tRNA preQ1(34) S-adenosylmethionine ribosyltransferase-isomerase QueA [Bryobacterales bacterium]|nr:tRNA preQ1(34) S-adenosylmethionine ribosyltransferase-isomerase QueA [Bryobacterales bacterium]
MHVSDFDYFLPAERIAQQPLQDRAASRMLVLDRRLGEWRDSQFRSLPEFLRPGDCLILNDTRVFPCRLFGHRGGVKALPVGANNRHRAEHLSGEVEVFLTRQSADDPLVWNALVRPGRKLPVGERITFAEGFTAEILARGEFGERTLRFQVEDELFPLIERHGHVPLPPYIHRTDSPEDRDRYQTVFADHRGSVAAPTAGLHFTPEVLAACRDAGASIAVVTLHVGLGTFQPLHEDVVERNRLHAERYEVSGEAASVINAARRRIAVGTTSARTLESVCRDGRIHPGSGETSLFLYPGYRFQAVDALLTNFHLPKSSLLMLVSAFAGTDLTLKAYNYAVSREYRFFSYGDCMLIL